MPPPTASASTARSGSPRRRAWHFDGWSDGCAGSPHQLLGPLLPEDETFLEPAHRGLQVVDVTGPRRALARQAEGLPDAADQLTVDRDPEGGLIGIPGRGIFPGQQLADHACTILLRVQSRPPSQRLYARPGGRDKGFPRPCSRCAVRGCGCGCGEVVDAATVTRTSPPVGCAVGPKNAITVRTPSPSREEAQWQRCPRVERRRSGSTRVCATRW